MLSKLNVLDTHVSTGTYREFLNAITELPRIKESAYVCFANVHMLITAHSDAQFSTVINSADVVAPDGKPVSLLMNSLHETTQDRVCGMDVLPDILAEASKKKLSVFFYGSTDEVLLTIKAKTREQFPHLKIAGQYSPPFRQLTVAEDLEIVDMINDLRPDLIFVSLGCPKQERWMYAHKDKVRGCMLGLGQAFLTYAGVEKRLPKWARNLSLEWLYRLCLEPRRLWQRYLVGNTLFILLASRSIFIKKTKLT